MDIKLTNSKKGTEKHIKVPAIVSVPIVSWCLASGIVNAVDLVKRLARPSHKI